MFMVVVFQADSLQCTWGR